MSYPHPLDILFLTNFSDYCYRAIPAIAQLADAFHTRLTLMHVFDPRRTSQEKAAQALESFFPEADRYPFCRRLAVPGPLLEAVKRHVEMWPVNLIAAPASDPIGLPRIGEQSLRARIIEECGVPVWSLGRRVRPDRLLQPVKNVACWLDFHAHKQDHLPFAIEFAHKLGATLHLLRTLPPVHEGSVVHASHADRALHPAGSAEEILRMCVDAPLLPRIHVGWGEGRRAALRMLAECEADVLFLRSEGFRLSRWLGLGLGWGDAVSCPAIHIGGRLTVPVWNLEPGPAGLAAIPPAAQSGRARHWQAVASAGGPGFLR
jgi:hypothetical protein